MSERQGEVFTFYSFKGGTGRSMALSNIACLLAGDGKNCEKVLVIDWDLEAPGLHRFFRKRIINEKGLVDDELIEEGLGLIDLFYEILEVAHTDKSFDEKNANSIFDKIDLSKYILKSNIPSLYLMKAGKFDKDYPSRVSNFDWTELYNNYPWLMKFFAEYLSKNYRYVIVDSRTGVSDISGITTMLLPDKLIVVFTPNRQSILGVLKLAKDAVNYRKQSNDLRPLMIFPLPSRIEASEPDLRNKWRYGDSDITGYQPEFEKLFKEIYDLNESKLDAYFDDVQIQHVPRYSYGEEIAVLVEESRDRLSLSASYERFKMIIAHFAAPWDYSENQLDTENSIYNNARMALIRGEYSEARKLLKQILKTEEESKDKNKIAATYNLLGVLAINEGDIEEARRFYQETLNIQRDLKNKEGVAQTLNQLGLLAQNTTNINEARRYYEESLSIRRSLGDKEGTAKILYRLGILAQDAENIDEAWKLIEESLGIARQLKDNNAVSNSLFQLGILATNTGNYDEARQLCQESLSISKDLGNKNGILNSLNQLGVLAYFVGNYDEARKLYQESLEISEELGDKNGISNSLHQLGVVEQDLGNYNEARKFYEKSLDISRELEDKSGISQSLHQLGMLEQDLGNYDEARKFYEKSLDISKEIGDKSVISQSLHQLGMLEQDLGNYDEARKFYQESQAIREGSGDKRGYGIYLAQLALLEAKLGGISKAIELTQQAESIFSELKIPHYVAKARMQKEYLEGSDRLAK